MLDMSGMRQYTLDLTHITFDKSLNEKKLIEKKSNQNSGKLCRNFHLTKHDDIL